MSISDWNKRWDDLRQVCRQRSLHRDYSRLTDEEFDMRPRPPAIIDIESPAKEEEVVEIEKEMGCSIPSSFRKVLREYARKIDISWCFTNFPLGDEEYKKIYHGRFQGFSRGILCWSLDELLRLQTEFKSWLTDCYNVPTDGYGKHWYGKFPAYEIGCGDFAAIEVKNPGSQQVVYLSHDGDGFVNGYPIGKDFEDFIDRISLLCCPSEGHALRPFINKPEPYLQVDGENARFWREWFGLSIDYQSF